MAEKALWDFVEALPEAERFEIATILPGAITGPPLIHGNFTVAQQMQAFMLGAIPAAPKAAYAWVDVRDCAQLHLSALEIPEAAGNRFLAIHEKKWLIDVLEALHAEFSPYGYPVVNKEAPGEGTESNLDNSKSRNILKMEYRCGAV